MTLSIELKLMTSQQSDKLNKSNENFNLFKHSEILLFITTGENLYPKWLQLI